LIEFSWFLFLLKAAIVESAGYSKLSEAKSRFRGHQNREQLMQVLGSYFLVSVIIMGKIIILPATILSNFSFIKFGSHFPP
jgi:hypothetical protein